MSQNQVILYPINVLFCIFSIISINVMAYFVNTPAFLQVIINSISCVYMGCILSSKIQKSVEQKVERSENSKDTETMTAKDAYLFPVYGSIVLFSIYIAFKYLPKEYLNIVFTVHFTILGLFCLASLLNFPLSKFTPAKWQEIQVINKKFTLNLIFTKQEIHLEYNYLQCICLAISIFPTIIYAMTKNWIYNNVFGIAFSVVGIENLLLPNFKVGFILLWGLFFYDIFWVYGTEVMITVAKQFDVPIKLMFPYNWLEVPPKFSMLGLGDIVIPGIFVALCLKYDIDNKITTTMVKEIHKMATPYFNWCFSGYVFGIIITFVVMVVFDHPQPALLFLVPSCTVSVLIKAFIDKKLPHLFQYEEGQAKKE